MTHHTNWRWAWLSAFILFILAATSGGLMRFGVLFGFPWGLQWNNIRHAHSHLMYFGWVTPALMSLMLTLLPKLQNRPLSPRHQRQFRTVIGLILFLALLAYGFFLRYGYGLATIGSARLPLSTIAASLNMLAWYWFMAVFWQASKGEQERPLPIRLWRAALGFMMLASMGAWGVAVVSLLDWQQTALLSSLTHLFLDTFSEGWFVMAMLGIIYAFHPQAGHHHLAKRGEDLLLAGLPVVFLLGVPTHVLPMPVRILGGIGGLLAGAGLSYHLWVLWTAVSSHWRVPLVFLGMKTAAMLLTTYPPAAVWAERAGLRISYLHWLLLGFITLALVAAAREQWQIRGERGLTAVVIILVLTLLPLTQLWPGALSGRWVLHAAAWGTTGPVLVAVGMMGLLLRRSIQHPIPWLQEDG